MPWRKFAHRKLELSLKFGRCEVFVFIAARILPESADVTADAFRLCLAECISVGCVIWLFLRL